MIESARKTLVFWSSGKDSAFMLQKLLEDKSIEVAGLVTTIRETDKKINIHETTEQDLEWQAFKLRLPLQKVYLPLSCPNTVYVERILSALIPLKSAGVTHLAFGDLFLKDIRKFREESFQGHYQLLFPLWNCETTELAKQIISSGIKARVVAVDEKKLSVKYIGRMFDNSFLEELPEGVDPCGENGEFHTFVYDSKEFK